METAAGKALALALIPFFVSDPSVLAFVLFVHLSVSAQWNIVGGCILSPLEHGDASNIKSDIIQGIADSFNTDYDTVGGLSVLVLNYVPAVVCLLKLIATF